MTHLVNCAKLQKEADGLTAHLIPANLAKRFMKSISQQAWQMWLDPPNHADK